MVGDGRRLSLRAPAAILLLLSAALAGAGEVESIEVGITTHLGDRQEFVAGDRLSFLLSLDRDAYVYLYYRDASGALLQFLPNEQMTDHFFRAGLFMPVPSAAQPFRFTVAPPFGAEAIYALASDNGEIILPGEMLGDGLIRLDLGIEQARARVREQSDTAFGAAELLIETAPAE